MKKKKKHRQAATCGHRAMITCGTVLFMHFPPNCNIKTTSSSLLRQKVWTIVDGISVKVLGVGRIRVAKYALSGSSLLKRL